MPSSSIGSLMMDSKKEHKHCPCSRKVQCTLYQIGLCEHELDPCVVMEIQHIDVGPGVLAKDTS